MSALALFAIFAWSITGETEAGEAGKFRIPENPTTSIDLGERVSDILLKDVTGDDYLDLFVALQHPRGGSVRFTKEKTTEIHLFVSNKGKFKRPSWSVEEKGERLALAMGDLDGDGDEDLLAVSRSNPGWAMAFRNRGKGKFRDKPFWEQSNQSACWGPQIADFDGDGHADIFIVGGGSTHFFFPGTKAGPSQTVAWSTDVGRPGAHAVRTDVDADEHEDIIVTHWLGGPAYGILRGTESGLERKYHWSSEDRGEYQSLAAGDVDGDGYPEIAVGSYGGRGGDARVRLYGNVKGEPTGTAVWMSDDVDALPVELILADLDGDGDLDLFVLGGKRSAIYENHEGKLSTTPAWRASLDSRIARIADLDRNGYPDLVLVTEGSVDIHYGSKKVQPKEAEPFPPMPEFPPLTADDLGGTAGGGEHAAVSALLDGPTPEEREEALAILAEQSARALIGLKFLGVIRSLSKPKLLSPTEPIRPVIEERVAELIEGLGATKEVDRKMARRGLEKCGIFALELLERAAEREDSDRSRDSGEIRDKIRSGMRKSAQGDLAAVEVLGLVLARITPRLRQRYGLETDEGALVLSVPDNVHQSLNVGNLREGDVIIGVGDSWKYGREVDIVKDPSDFLRLSVENAPRHSAKAKMIGMQWRCGPKHPSIVGEIRRERTGWLSEAAWEELKRVHADPKPWIP
ncbi:MAG: FG-GAP-like repeat-containing protein [Planctomycetota bacterium]|nr:FG-GAP-like repeat-containing protein [Planctomycetota bacterium]